MRSELKERRKRRLKNHAAKALRDPQFRPRVVKPKEKEKPLREILKELEEDASQDAEEELDGV